MEFLIVAYFYCVLQTPYGPCKMSRPFETRESCWKERQHDDIKGKQTSSCEIMAIATKVEPRWPNIAYYTFEPFWFCDKDKLITWCYYRGREE